MAEKTKRTFAGARNKFGMNEKARESSREFKRIKKQIHEVLKGEPSTIPRIAEALGISEDMITYHLMTCRKYGEIEVTGMDDMDEYFIYGLKKEE